MSGDEGYHRAIEWRLAKGTWGRGPVAAWLRPRVPLVAGETPTPLECLVTAADSASGVAVVVDPARTTFVNGDLTIALHRAPAGEWICLDAAATGDDRLVVEIAPGGSSGGSASHGSRALRDAPYVRLMYDGLGAEFFRWEVATATAGFLLGVNPFDEPDVQLVDESGCLKGGVRLFAGHVVVGQRVELSVDERYQSVARALVASSPGAQESSHFRLRRVRRIRSRRSTL